MITFTDTTGQRTSLGRRRRRRANLDFLLAVAAILATLLMVIISGCRGAEADSGDSPEAVTAADAEAAQAGDLQDTPDDVQHPDADVQREPAASAESEKNSEEDPKRQWAKPIECKGVPNLARVTPLLYRGGEPDEQGVRKLHEMGIRTIVSLRLTSPNEEAYEKLGMKFVRVRTNALMPTDVAAARFLETVTREGDGPFFVNCWLGVDRTALMCAVYRVAIQGWTREQAIEEMTGSEVGYNSLFNGQEKWLRNADIDQIRADAGLPTTQPDDQ